jgi:hypothetical protein
MSRRRMQTAASPQASTDRLLGEMKGQLDMIHEAQLAHGTKLDTLDTRLRHTENRTAVMGAAAGLCVAVCVEFVKGILRRP